MPVLEKKFSVIVADDDNEEHVFLREVTNALRLNIDYTAVYNGGQLLDLLMKRGPYHANRQKKPDAVILDLNMPELDGLGALRQIKSVPELKELPVFILYSLTTGDYSTQCRELGIAGLYIKPSSLSGIRTIFREIFSICGGKAPKRAHEYTSCMGT